MADLISEDTNINLNRFFELFNKNSMSKFSKDTEIVDITIFHIFNMLKECINFLKKDREIPN